MTFAGLAVGACSWTHCARSAQLVPPVPKHLGSEHAHWPSGAGLQLCGRFLAGCCKGFGAEELAGRRCKVSRFRYIWPSESAGTSFLPQVCRHLGEQTTDLEAAAHPALDALTRKVTTTTLERVRRVKTRLVRLKTRVETVRCCFLCCVATKRRVLSTSTWFTVLVGLRSSSTCSSAEAGPGMQVVKRNAQMPVLLSCLHFPPHVRLGARPQLKERCQEKLPGTDDAQKDI